MPGPDFPTVLRIVLKILSVQHPVVISQKPVSLHQFRIKFYLQLHILADCQKRCRHLLRQHLFCLLHTIYVSIVAISLIRQRFHLIVFDIIRPETKHGQENPGLFFPGNQFFQFLLGGHTDIQITVCRQNHTVITAFDKIVFRQCVSRLNSPAAPGAAACFQTVQSLLYFPLLTADCTFEHNRILRRVGHNRYPVPTAEIICEFCKSRLQKRQLVRLAHGAGDVQQKH